MFDFAALAAASTNPKEALTRANFAVQDKLGKFMSLGSRVITIRDRAKGSAATEKAQALLDAITEIQTRALSVLGEAKTLQEKVAASPSLADVKSATSIARDLYAINADMDIQTAKVNAFEREVAGLPQASRSEIPWMMVAGVAAVVLAFLYMRGKRK